MIPPRRVVEISLLVQVFFRFFGRGHSQRELLELLGVVSDGRADDCGNGSVIVGVRVVGGDNGIGASGEGVSPGVVTDGGEKNVVRRVGAREVIGSGPKMNGSHEASGSVDFGAGAVDRFDGAEGEVDEVLPGSAGSAVSRIGDDTVMGGSSGARGVERDRRGSGGSGGSVVSSTNGGRFPGGGKSGTLRREVGSVASPNSVGHSSSKIVPMIEPARTTRRSTVPSITRLRASYSAFRFAARARVRSS